VWPVGLPTWRGGLLWAARSAAARPAASLTFAPPLAWMATLPARAPAGLGVRFLVAGPPVGPPLSRAPAAGSMSAAVAPCCHPSTATLLTLTLASAGTSTALATATPTPTVGAGAVATTVAAAVAAAVIVAAVSPPDVRATAAAVARAAARAAARATAAEAAAPGRPGRSWGRPRRPKSLAAARAGVVPATPPRVPRGSA